MPKGHPKDYLNEKIYENPELINNFIEDFNNLLSYKILCYKYNISNKFIKILVESLGLFRSKESVISKSWEFVDKQTVLERRRQTCLKGYGVDSFSKTNTFKQLYKEVWQNKTKEELDQIQTKRERTCFEHYGVSSPMQSKIVQQKFMENCYQKTGKFWYLQDPKLRQKGKETLVQKYGEHPYRSPQILNKKEATCLEKYGVPYNLQRKDVRQVIIEKLEQAKEKEYQTKKANHSFNSSKPEESIHNLLLEKFPDCIHIYKDKERYPFLCDFYIPSLDLFIEINFHWTHGFHPYNPNDPKDLETVKTWEAKAKELNHKGKPKDLYKMALKVWTERDVLKQETARKNNLNYKVFYNIKEFDSWFYNFII